MPQQDLQALLDDIVQAVRPATRRGRVADYIPALAAVPADRVGIALHFADGRTFTAGDAEESFSIQSVSKVFTLTMALNHVGYPLWKRVGREPSGNPFNSLVQLERENGIPRNPFINAGALVVMDALMAKFADPASAFRKRMIDLTGNKTLRIDKTVYESELDYGDLNRAIAYFLKAHGNLHNSVDAVTRAYFKQCSLAMSCADLARAALFLANRGVSFSGERVLSSRQTKRVNAVMETCGLYDAVGEFAYRVGTPGKSGVGGGIVAVLPGLMSVCVWSPALNRQGNSVAGLRALEILTTRLGRSVF
ncbi:MAG: glutaminase [Alphaproteobacteria bacterium]|nr:glutaminase [Alphaproteobacteria bacterium]